MNYKLAPLQYDSFLKLDEMGKRHYKTATTYFCQVVISYFYNHSICVELYPDKQQISRRYYATCYTGEEAIKIGEFFHQLFMEQVLEKV